MGKENTIAKEAIKANDPKEVQSTIHSVGSKSRLFEAMDAL